MFSNLAQGSILYGIEVKNNEVNVFTAPVISVSTPKPVFTNNNNYGQMPQLVVDIIATVAGERREFKQVPSNAAIADFGSQAFILADSKESINSYLDSIIQNSERKIAEAEACKDRLSSYKQAYNKLNINSITSDNDYTKNLEQKVDKLEQIIMEFITLSKNGNNN
jgi:hypothetical protein